MNGPQNTASSNGIGDNIFGPDYRITREQIATILYRYAGYLKLDTSNKVGFSAFEDGQYINNFAIDDMKWATANGVLNGSWEFRSGRYLR